MLVVFNEIAPSKIHFLISHQAIKESDRQVNRINLLSVLVLVTFV